MNTVRHTSRPQSFDRRIFASSLGAALVGVTTTMCRSANVATRRLPRHVSCETDGPNALVLLTVKQAQLASAGNGQGLLPLLETFIQVNRDVLSKSRVVVTLADRAKEKNLPTTIQQFYEVFQQSWSPAAATPAGSLCIEGPGGTCIDTGCDARCDAIGFSGGDCWTVPRIFQDLGLDTCECVCKPPWYEVALLALIALILFATPGPDEVPAMLAAIARYIVRAAPAFAVP